MISLKKLVEEGQLYTNDFYAEIAKKWNKKSVVKDTIERLTQL